MTARETILKANELARDFYRLMGYEVADGYRFDKATHPHERRCWDMAAVAFERLQFTDLDEVLVEFEIEEDGE